MNERVTSLLKKINMYHPLQSAYRLGILHLLKWYYRAAYFRYRGKGFTCNFCGASYKRFVAEYPSSPTRHAIERYQVVAGFGENVYCPHCLSKNRERLLKAVLDDNVKVEGKKVLHISPERSLYCSLKGSADVQTADLAPGFYRSIDKKIIEADATHLPFADHTFDLVIANHILEHIPDDLRAMKEFHRVLKDGGLAILQVPYSQILSKTVEDPLIDDPAKQELLYGQKDHVRIYGFDDYVGRLRMSGFSVTILSPEMLACFRCYAIQETESVFLCKKE